MSLYIDISEFLSSPHRTGIQRVTGELIWHWPRGYPMAAVMITRDARMVRLPENAVAVIKDYFGSTEHQVSGFLAQIESMRAAAEASPHVPLLPDDLLLCPEVFWDPVRIYFYESRTPELHGCYRFIIYDLLVLTH